MLSDGFDKSAIADKLCEEFGLEHKDALKDVEDFLEQINNYCSAD